MNPRLRRLNRQVHIYAGLSILLFTMLFSATGLLLNRHWAFAEFWDRRKIERFDGVVHLSGRGGDLAIAREVMRQLHLRGEIASTEVTPEGRLKIQAGRPGENLTIETDVASGRTSVEKARFNGWGVVRTLHTFVGVSASEPERRRDWWLTSLWSLAMDATAFGLVLLVIGGLVEAWAANPRRGALATTFVLATSACLAFVLGVVR